MSDMLAQKVLEKLKLDWIEIFSVQKGYRNKTQRVKLRNGDFCNIIFYKNEAGILQKILCANSVGEFVSKCGMKVRHPILPILKIANNKYACVYNYLEGKSISWENFGNQKIKNLGIEMANFHKFSKNYDQISFLPKEIDLQKKNMSRMLDYFADVGVKLALQNKLGLTINFDKFLKYFFDVILKTLHKSKKSVLHMDFVRGNILFKENEISGILDLEKVSFGFLQWDIARTMTFLLTDTAKNETELKKYYLKKGYLKKHSANLKKLNYFMIYFLVYDFYKFLKHNPFEDLNQNYHFLNTLNILQKVKLAEKI